MRTRLTTSIVIAISVAALTAGVAARQARDAGTQASAIVAPSGTAVLTGVLLTDSPTPRPVRRATVRLAGAGGTSTRIVGTDDEVRFTFGALPAGSFTLSATKPGFVQTFHGSKHPGRGPGVPVAIAEGGRIEVTLRILPGAVITGTITDARGNPAPAVPVLAVEMRPAGAATATPLRTVTDDRGMYRIFGLAPGDYLVSALPRVVPSAAGRGNSIVDVVGVTDAEVQWARAAGATGVVSAGSAAMPPPGRLVSYAPVFYPGTTAAAAAAKVSLGAGQERADVGMSLQIVSMATIGGSIVDSDGQPVTVATVSLFPRRSDRASTADLLVSSGALVLPRATVSATGFSISNVAPGEYTLVARSGSGQRATVAAPAAPALWSVTDLSVDGNDRTDLMLRLLPGVKLSGSIVFEHASLTPPDDSSSIDLSLTATGSSIGAASVPRAVVDPKGTFRFSSIVPGMYSLITAPPATAAGAHWTLKSAIFQSRDLADGPFEVKQGDDIEGLVITFTDHAAEVSGRLVDASGRPITRYSIVVFPADRSLWLPSSRRIRLTPPATDGSFTVAGLPPGDYAIAAAEDVEAADLSDPSLLLQFLAAAVKVTLADSEKKRQDLRIGGSH